MVDAKSVVIYGVVVTGSNHHTDYILLGDWEFLLVEKVAIPVKPPEFRKQYRSVRTGKFVSRRSRAKKVEVLVPIRRSAKGTYESGPVSPEFAFGVLPSDATIIADTKAIVEEVTGARMYRTAGQAEAGQHNVDIGVQHLTMEQYLGTMTYTYQQYLAEVRKRVENEKRYA